MVLTYHIMQSTFVAIEKVILMSTSKVCLSVPSNLLQFMTGRNMLDTKKTCISNAKAIQKKLYHDEQNPSTLKNAKKETHHNFFPSLL